MSEWQNDRIMDLRNAAAALEALSIVKTVELSLPTIWLVRDLIGIERLSERAQIYGHATQIPMRDDMVRLGEVTGHRPVYRPTGIYEAHVAHWSEKAAAKAVGRSR